MQTNVDIRVAQSEELLPIDIKLGDKRALKRLKSKQVEYELPPMLFLSQKFLQVAPAEALVNIKGSRDGKIPPRKSYRKMMSHLAKFRASAKFVQDDFIQDLICYLQDAEVIFLESLERKDAILQKYEINKSRVPPKLIPFRLGKRGEFSFAYSWLWDGDRLSFFQFLSLWSKCKVGYSGARTH